MRASHDHARKSALVAAGVLLQLALSITAAQAAEPRLAAQAAAVQALTERDLSRIAVAGGAVTEILYTLGLASRIVAVDSTSLFPTEALKTKKNLGYFRALSTEGVLSVNPTLIIASDRAGPPEVVSALKSSIVPYIEIDDRPDPEALLTRIRTLAHAVSKDAEGEKLADRIAQKFRELDRRRAKLTDHPRVLFVLAVQSGKIIVGGRNTAADTVMTLAGARNAADTIDGHKPISEEALIAMNPDVILVTSGSSGPSGSRERLLALNGIRGTTAGRDERFIEMDGLYLLGFGPRTPDAVEDLMVMLAARPDSSSQGAMK